MAKESLTPLFNEVKKTYFPHWKAGNEWTVRRNHPRLRGKILQGICMPQEKTIVIKLPSKKYERAVLAHEICHAVTGSKYHGKKWGDRLSMVANKATQLGQKEFAGLVREDLKGYRNELPMRKGAEVQVYRNMQYIISQYPDASFEQVMAWMVEEFGYSGAQLKRYRNLEKYYGKFKKQPMNSKQSHTQYLSSPLYLHCHHLATP